MQYVDPDRAYTRETQRLQLAAPQAVDLAGRAALPTWAMFALLIVVLLLVLARMPSPAAQPVVMPMVDNHVEIFSRNCIGYCP